MEVSGVRSSWLTMDTSSLFIRSMRLRSVMSRTRPMNLRSPWWLICETRSSMVKVSPLRRRAVSSRFCSSAREVPRRV